MKHTQNTIQTRRNAISFRVVWNVLSKWVLLNMENGFRFSHNVEQRPNNHRRNAGMNATATHTHTLSLSLSLLLPLSHCENEMCTANRHYRIYGNVLSKRARCMRIATIQSNGSEEVRITCIEWNAQFQFRFLFCLSHLYDTHIGWMYDPVNRFHSFSFSRVWTCFKSCWHVWKSNRKLERVHSKNYTVSLDESHVSFFVIWFWYRKGTFIRMKISHFWCYTFLMC